MKAIFTKKDVEKHMLDWFLSKGDLAARNGEDAFVSAWERNEQGEEILVIKLLTWKERPKKEPETNILEPDPYQQ